MSETKKHPSYDPLLKDPEAGQVLNFSPAAMKKSRLTGTLGGFPAPKFVRTGPKQVAYYLSTLLKWRSEHYVEVSSTSEEV